MARRPFRFWLRLLSVLWVCGAGCGDDTALRQGAAAAAATSPPEAAAASAPAAAQRYAYDDPGDRTLTLPEAIVRGLQTDAAVLDCPQGTRAGVSQFAPDWVAARRFDLDGDGRGDWIVNGRHDCLRRAGAAAWWVYADAADGPRLLLAAPAAGALEVLPQRSDGFRDLRLAGGNGDAIARYAAAEGGYRLP